MDHDSELQVILCVRKRERESILQLTISIDEKRNEVGKNLSRDYNIDDFNIDAHLSIKVE